MRAVFLPAAWIALAAAPAFGQAATEAEIVITAPLSTRGDLLQGAAVLDRNDIIANLGGGLGETLDKTPGVSSTFFGAGASRPVIRGLGEDRIRILSGGLGQIDASAISPDHAVAAEGLEASRIEVLRGPAALAYGGNAIGGVVNVLDQRIVETRPDKALSGEVLVGLATGLNSAEIAGGVTGAWGPLVLRLEGFKRNAGDFAIPGYAFSAAEREEEILEGADPDEFARGEASNSFAEASQGAIGLSFVGERGFAGISYKQLESLYGLPGHAHEHDPLDPEPIFAGPRIGMESKRTDIRAGWRPRSGLIEALRAGAALVDYAHTEFEDTGEAGTVFTNEGHEGRVELIHRDIAGFRGILGASAFSTDFAAEGDESFIAPTTTSNAGLFLIEKRGFGPLSVEAGARLERVKLDNESFLDRDFDLISGSLGAGWGPVERLFLGVTVGYAERAPTQVELYSNAGGALVEHAATAAIEVGDELLGKEKARTIEATARWQSQRFSIEANIYQASFDGFIAALDTGLEEDEVPIFQYSQADATFRGAEIVGELNLLDTDDLKLSADLGADYVRAKFDAGGNVPRIPPLSVTLGLEGEAGRFGGRLEWAHTADAKDLAGFETPTDGADVFNARLSFRPVAGSDRLVLLVDARNLTDEEVRVHTSFVKALLPRPGRSVRLAISSKF